MAGGWSVDPIWVCIMGASEELLSYLVELGAVVVRDAAGISAAKAAAAGGGAIPPELAVRRVVIATTPDAVGVPPDHCGHWQAAQMVGSEESISDSKACTTLREADVHGAATGGAPYAPLPWWVELHRRVYGKPRDAELVTICDARNNVIGACYRDQLRARVLFHRSSYIIVEQIRSKASKASFEPRRFYVQKRTAIKDYMPSRVDPAPGGTVAAGESIYVNAAREIVEEMGIVPDAHPDGTHQRWGTPATALPLTHLLDVSFDTPTQRVHGGVYHCRTWLPRDRLDPQASEVAAVYTMTAAEIAQIDDATGMPDGTFMFRQALPRILQPAPRL